MQAVPCFCELYCGISLTTEEEARKTSARVAAPRKQSDTLQYKNNEQYNSQKNNRSQNNKEHRIHNREKCPLQVSKQCVMEFKIK
jgi:hypothetical protein